MFIEWHIHEVWLVVSLNFFTNFMDQSLILTSYEKLLILWRHLDYSLISVDRLDLHVVVVYVGVYSKTICTRAQAARYVTCGSGWIACTSEGGAVMSRCGFRSVRYLKVNIRCKNALGPRIVSAVQSLEVVASWRLPMYYKYRIFNPWLELCPL